MAKDQSPQSEAQVTVNLDTTPIFYTDSINMTTNEDGVVLDVLQRVGNTNQMKIVSRVGMSRSHAKKFLDLFGKLILLTEGTNQTGKNKN